MGFLITLGSAFQCGTLQYIMSVLSSLYEAGRERTKQLSKLTELRFASTT